jgi:hypothetical protein
VRIPGIGGFSKEPLRLEKSIPEFGREAFFFQARDTIQRSSPPRGYLLHSHLFPPPNAEYIRHIHTHFVIYQETLGGGSVVVGVDAGGSGSGGSPGATINKLFSRSGAEAHHTPTRI